MSRHYPPPSTRVAPMSHSWLRRWFGRIEPQARRAPIRKGAFRPDVLRLEDRWVPAAWQDLAAIPASPTNAPAYLHPDSARPLAIDLDELRAELALAPRERTPGAAPLVF